MDKALHVSPFMGMDQRYELRAAAPAETLSVHIEAAATASARSTRRSRCAGASCRARSLAGVTARYPAATLRVLALIYAHAFG